MKENIPLNKNINQIKNLNNPDDQLLLLINEKLGKKANNLPNDENIKLILQNDDIKNLIKYTLNKHNEIQQDIEIRKKLNNKLKNIKNQRKNYIEKNEELIKEINEESKKDKLARVKLKILGNSRSTLILDIQNEYKKYSYLNGYKYSHLYPKKNIGSIIENENDEKEEENLPKENFNIINNDNMENKNIINEGKEEDKKEEQISFINASNDISNINDSKINQIINLPKLTEEEINKYTKYSQKLFFDKTINELKMIKDSMSAKEEKPKNKREEQISLISITSMNSNNDKLQKSKEIIAVENKAKQKIKNKNEEQNYKEFFSEISTKFKNDIQKEEFNISKNYADKTKEENNDFTYNQALDELKINQKENKRIINTEIWQKIVDISKVRLIKDINNKYLKAENKNLNSEKIKEIIIPKCIIEKNPQDTLNFYRNVINTYKKYKQRTNNFINKRLLPGLLLLDEKYTDFITTLINEYDYFVKLTFENMKEDNDNIYSLKKFKYDLNLLKKNGIKSKYDLFGLYISNIFMKDIILENDKIMNEFKKGKTLEIYLENIKKNNDIKKSIAKYIKGNVFNEDLNLYFNKNELNLIHQYLKEFLNIDYIKNLNPFNP